MTNRENWQHAALLSTSGLTKMMSKLSKEGDADKALEVFYALPELGITYDTTITNAAISSCDKGGLPFFFFFFVYFFFLSSSSSCN